MVHVFARGTARTNPAEIPDTTPVFGDVVAHVDGRDLYLEVGDVVDDVPFDEAVDVADEDWLRGRAERLHEARERGERTEVRLTSDRSRLRGFGGGMLTVIDGDTTRVAGPRRDFGPISHKGMLDISAGRTMYPAADESWLDLVVREGVEEVAVIDPSRPAVLAPSYDSVEVAEAALDGLMREFDAARSDPDSPLHGADYATGTYDAELVPPEDAARVDVEVDGDRVVFDAGIGFEPETSSIEAFLYNRIDAADLPDGYVLHDTENMETDDGHVHFDREAYEIDAATGDVTVYAGGGSVRETTVREFLAAMDHDFAANEPGEPADHYGAFYATVKFRNAAAPSAWPFGDAPALEPFLDPTDYAHA